MVRLLVKDSDIVIASLGKMNGGAETEYTSSNNNDWIMLGHRRSGHSGVMIGRGKIKLKIGSGKIFWKPMLCTYSVLRMNGC